MNRVIRIVQAYLVLAFPFVLACAVWSGVQQSPSGVMDSKSAVVTVAWEVLSWNLMLWFAALMGFLVTLIFSSVARESTLKRLASISERDEREKYITGKAARSAYLSTLSVLILLLVMSVITVKVSKLPAGASIDGKTNTVSIGINMSLTDATPAATASAEQVVIESKGIPLSKSAIILVLLAWQLFMFNRTARKEMQIA